MLMLIDSVSLNDSFVYIYTVLRECGAVRDGVRVCFVLMLCVLNTFNHDIDWSHNLCLMILK